jgi:hypothetical protein
MLLPRRRLDDSMPEGTGDARGTMDGGKDLIDPNRKPERS